MPYILPKLHKYNRINFILYNALACLIHKTIYKTCVYYHSMYLRLSKRSNYLNFYNVKYFFRQNLSGVDSL